MLKEILTQGFSCEIGEIFKSTYFEEHLWTAASETCGGSRPPMLSSVHINDCLSRVYIVQKKTLFLLFFYYQNFNTGDLLDNLWRFSEHLLLGTLFSCFSKYCHWKRSTLREKCLDAEFFWLVFSRIQTEFSNAGKYGPENLQIPTLFPQLSQEN